MSIKAELVGTNGRATQVPMAMHQRFDVPPSMLVYTEPFRDVTASFETLLNDEYGAAFNQNLEFGGTPELVHDGGTPLHGLALIS